MAHLIQQACFLTAPKDIGTVVPCFTRALDLRGPVRSARLHISALGMYQAAIDGAESTKNMTAVKGRAYYQADKGIHHIDPGAVTMSYQICILMDYLIGKLEA